MTKIVKANWIDMNDEEFAAHFKMCDAKNAYEKLFWTLHEINIFLVEQSVDHENVIGIDGMVEDTVEYWVAMKEALCSAAGFRSEERNVDISHICTW